jgi:LmbE family N-acetylglucosaminyl deacetylase
MPVKKVEQLRAQLAALIADRRPVGQTGRQMWALAEEIAAHTGESVREVFKRGTRDAVTRLRAEVER